MWVFDPKISDYVNIETGQIMINYMPSDDLSKILLNNIDIQQN